MLAQADNNLRKRSPDYDKAPGHTEALRNEYRKIFLKHVSGENSGMIFDVYISPKYAPPEMYENKLYGLRTIPIRGPQLAKDNEIEKFEREARDK